METSLKWNRKVMEVNYFGTIATTKFLLPQFLKQKEGISLWSRALRENSAPPTGRGMLPPSMPCTASLTPACAELWKENIKVTLYRTGLCPNKDIRLRPHGDGSRLNEMDDTNGMACRWPKRQSKSKRHCPSKTKVHWRQGSAGRVCQKVLPGLFNKIIRKAKVR